MDPVSQQLLSPVLIEAITAAKANFPPDDPLIAAIQQGGRDIKLTDLNFDSLAWMEFCISVELATGAELTPEHLEHLETLGEPFGSIEHLDQRQRGRGQRPCTLTWLRSRVGLVPSRLC